MDIFRQWLKLENPLDKGSLFAILGVGLGALMPIFFHSGVGQLSVEQMLLILGGVAVYFLLTTFGFEWYLQNFSWKTAVLYFGSHLLLFIALESMMPERGLYFWLLPLPVAGQGISLPRWGTVTVASLFLAAMVFVLRLADVSWGNIWDIMWSIVAAMIFVILFTYVVERETDTRQKLEVLTGELQDANQKLIDYALQVEDLTLAKERNRMAREIHDTLGHYLTVINMQLSAAQAVIDTQPETAKEAVNKAQKLSKEGLAEVRHSVSALREKGRDEQRPLPDTLKNLLAEIQTTGVTTALHIQGQPKQLSPQAHLTLYRAAQEALTNARKYAQATHIDLVLAYSQLETQLTVTDNGVGSEKAEGGFGLLGLRERVQLLGGTFDCQTAPNEGFSLQVSVPFSQ